MLALFDTDFLYSFLFKNQSNHQKSVEILKKYDDLDFVISKAVKYEFLTVISNKEDQEKAKESYSKLGQLELRVLEISQEIEDIGFEIFLSSSKNKTSMVDCLNLSLAQKLDCKIASFDKFYPKEKLLTLEA